MSEHKCELRLLHKKKIVLPMVSASVFRLLLFCLVFGLFCGTSKNLLHSFCFLSLFRFPYFLLCISFSFLVYVYLSLLTVARDYAYSCFLCFPFSSFCFSRLLCAQQRGVRGNMIICLLELWQYETPILYIDFCSSIGERYFQRTRAVACLRCVVWDRWIHS